MGHQLSPEHKELYRRVDEVLHYLWDPIGVSDVPEARDEYHSYLPHIFSLLIRRVSAQEITDFLTHTSTQPVGAMSSTSTTRSTPNPALQRTGGCAARS